MKINAFCTDRYRVALDACDKLFFCGNAESVSEKTRIVSAFGEHGDGDDIYIPSLTDETVLEQACDYLVSTSAHAMVKTAFDLDETGLIEARYKLSPIMLLHKLGVLNKCVICGGVCLDNDDLDLMAQENVPLVVTPTASAGYGCGYAPVCAALARGIRVGVGTFDGKYNPSCSIDAEIGFLRLTMNSEMRCENALSDSDLRKILAFDL